MSDNISTLTDAQARTLADLMDRGYISERMIIIPHRIFSGRESGKRLCCIALVAKGLFRLYSSIPNALMPNVQACRDAWAVWREKNPDVEI